MFQCLFMIMLFMTGDRVIMKIVLRFSLISFRSNVIKYDNCINTSILNTRDVVSVSNVSVSFQTDGLKHPSHADRHSRRG